MSPRFALDLERLYADAVLASRLAGVVCHRATTWPILSAYRGSFTKAAVSFRTSTRAPAERGLNLRYVNFDEPTDPYPIALAHGFLAKSGGPIDTLLPEIQRQCPVVGYGVDLGVSTGLEKIWPFFPQRPQSVAGVSAMPSMPAAVRSHAPYFARHGLDGVSLFALDYRSRTVNLYFMRAPGTLSTARLAALIGDLGFAVPGEEILRHCALAVPIYFTFSWGSPRVERVCFGVVAPGPGSVPAHVHPLLERYVQGAPFAGGRRAFIYSVTLSRGELFFKIENDYSGSMTALMRV